MLSSKLRAAGGKYEEQGLWCQSDWSSTPAPPTYCLHGLGAVPSISELSFLIRELGIKHIYHPVATVMQAPVCISGKGLITLATVYLLTCLSSPFYGKTPQGNNWLHLHVMVYTQVTSTPFFHFLKVTPSSYSQAYL